jgi:hypothetical protein
MSHNGFLSRWPIVAELSQTRELRWRRERADINDAQLAMRVPGGAAVTPWGRTELLRDWNSPFPRLSLILVILSFG